MYCSSGKNVVYLKGSGVGRGCRAEGLRGNADAVLLRTKKTEDTKMDLITGIKEREVLRRFADKPVPRGADRGGRGDRKIRAVVEKHPDREIYRGG